jgi:hypothetical protein
VNPADDPESTTIVEVDSVDDVSSQQAQWVCTVNYKYSGAPTMPFTAVEYGTESNDLTEGVTDEIPLQLRTPE